MLVAVAAGAYFMQHGAPQKPAAVAEIPVPMATPIGVTMQDTGMRLANQGGYDRPPIGVAYANADGMTLYTSDSDSQPGKSACNGDCAKEWPPLAVLPNVAAPPGWSVIARDDGTKQWAFEGKPLYASTKDMKIGDINGKSADGWKVAYVDLAKNMALPDGIATQELTNAGGQALVDGEGMPMYTFDGDAVHDKSACTSGPCPNLWTPVVAAQLARQVGDFTVVGREDGIYQWAYKGKLLYTFDGDTRAGDAVGTYVDKRWRVALLSKYFMPAGITVAHNHFGGFNLATADGMTIYQRGRWRAVNGGHILRTGSRDHPAVGRLLGASTCDAQCTQTWHPVKASADAQPTGYWSIITRDDGSRQWVYQGYPLYTYVGDTKPGDMAGNDITDYMPVNGGDVYLAADKLSFKDGGGGNAAAMYWHVTLP